MDTIIFEFDKEDRAEVLEVLKENGITFTEQSEERLTGAEILIGIVIPFTTMTIPIIVDLIKDKIRNNRAEKKERAREEKQRSNVKRAIFTKDGRFTLENYSREDAIGFLEEYKMRVEK